MASSESLGQHIGAMGVIFVISLLAVSFPALSKRVRFLSIPKILFFIGKHFGTGVILSTAFCHLLQDSFEALTSELVKSGYPGVGEQTGLIILVSLLTIFVIEYISTSYVDHLHEEPSTDLSESQEQVIDESTHLLSPSVHSQHSHSLESSSFLRQSLSKASKTHHYLSSIVNNSPRHSRATDSFYIINDINYHLNNGEYHLLGGKGACVCVCVCPASETSERPGTRAKLVVRSLENMQRPGCALHTNEPNDVDDDDDVESQRPAISRKRQVVGILVLQFGIMIHSLVIGLTLSVTSGSEFTTLVTAIIFHQLFEGLSLGIRIATIPPPQNESDRASSPSPSSKSILQPVLTILFAITTPIGIGLGMLVFTSTTQSSEARMRLTQGLMSAISAGLLIYAATVEMLAGDFVFGNLGGHGTGGHGHGHGGEIPEDHSDDQEEKEEEDEEGISAKRRVLAVGSLLAGVLAMSMIGE